MLAVTLADAPVTVFWRAPTSNVWVLLTPASSDVAVRTSDFRYPSVPNRMTSNSAAASVACSRLTAGSKLTTAMSRLLASARRTAWSSVSLTRGRFVLGFSVMSSAGPTARGAGRNASPPSRGRSCGLRRAIAR